MMATPSPSQQPKGIDELIKKNQSPKPEALPGGGEGDGQPQGNLRPVPPPKKGVDVGGVPTQKPTTSPTPGPQGPAIPGGGQGSGKPSGQLAPAPEAGPKPSAPGSAKPAPAAASGATPAGNQPVDTAAVGKPLGEELFDPDESDDDDQQDSPDLNRLREDEPDAGEDEGEQAGEEEGQGSEAGEESGEGGEETESEEESGEPEGEAGEAASEEGASGAMSGEAAGAGAEAGAAGGEAAAAGATEAGAAVAASPVGWVAIAIAAVIFILAIIFILVIPGISGGGSSDSERSPAGGEISGDTQALAQQILDDKNITANPNPTGSLQAAAQGKCSPAPTAGACVMLDERLLKAILTVAQKRPLIITSLTTGVHTGCSNHYEGRAADLGSTDRSILDLFQKEGATELLGPGDPDHDDHLHVGWDGPHKHCAG